ncbi:hypothetical protein GCM10009780_78030 [Actinomadura alba]
MAGAVLELVSGLVEKSIVLREETPDGLRFRLLTTLRAYGEEWLRTLGEERTLLRRHRDYYLRLAEQAQRDWFGPEQLGWLRRLEREHANLSAALDFCLEAAQNHAGMRLAAALRFHWLHSGRAAEGRRWLERCLALTAWVTAPRVRALGACALLAGHQGDLDAAARLSGLGRELAERLGDPLALAQATHHEGAAAVSGGDAERGAALLEEALARYGALGVADHADAVLARLALAVAADLRGDTDGAIELCRAGLVICRERGDSLLQAYALYVLARAEWTAGDGARATAHARDAVRLARDLPDPVALAGAVELLAWIAETDGGAERAAVLLGAAHGLRRAYGFAGMSRSVLLAHHQGCLQRTRRALGQSAHEAAFQRGGDLSLEQAVAWALGQAPRRPAPGRPTPRQATPGRPTPGPPDRHGGPPLSPRESQVAELVAEGLSNRQIAERLSVAKRTVDAHVEHILTKLGFSSRTRIAAWVIERRNGGR